MNQSVRPILLFAFIASRSRDLIPEGPIFHSSAMFRCRKEYLLESGPGKISVYLFGVRWEGMTRAGHS